MVSFPKLFLLSFCFIFLIFTSIAFSQDMGSMGVPDDGFGMNPVIRKVVPPSPSVSNFLQSKYGSLHKNTGAVNVNIPLFTLTTGDLSLPISISYFSQGNKVDQSISRVGLGWNLDAGAVISRTVRGLPDETSVRDYREDSLFSTSSNMFYYYSALSNPVPSFDTQNDEYNYSVAGYSGKFVIRRDSSVILTENHNVKIEIGGVSRSIIIITTPDGNKYYFGGLYAENLTTSSITLMKNILQSAYTSLFLYKIESPKGHYMIFNYTQVNTQSISEQSESILVNPPPPMSNSLPHNDCGSCVVQEGIPVMSKMTNYYKTYRISSIETNFGDRVNFMYDQIGDLSYDSRLRSVSKLNTELGISTFIEFEYRDLKKSNVPHDTTGNLGYKRYFLTKMKVSELEYNHLLDVGNQEKVFEFEYIDIENSAIAHSLEQDYAGFHNGIPNSHLFSAGVSNYVNPIYLGNRNVSHAHAKRGMLEKVKYPNGLIEEFVYEGNIIHNTVPAPVQDSILTVNSLYPVSPVGTYYVMGRSIVIPKDQEVELLIYNSMKYPENPVYSNDTLRKIITFLFYENGIVRDSFFLNRTQSYIKVNRNLFKDHTYRLDIRQLNDAQMEAEMYFVWDHDTTGITPMIRVQNAVPGLRVKEINYYENNLKTSSKFFKYEHIFDLGYSSGVVLSSPEKTSALYQSLTNCSVWVTDPPVCTYYSITSYTSSDFSIFNGSPIFYSSIIESNAKNLNVNGGTLYEFYPPAVAQESNVILGSEVPGVPNHNYVPINGQLHKVIVFDSAFSIIKESEDIYEQENIPGKVDRNLVVTRNYEPFFNFNHDPSVYFKVFNVVEYYYATSSIRKTKTINKEFANGQELVSEVSYEFNNYTNNQPSQVITKASNNDTIVLSYTYSTDLLHDVLQNKKVANNQISDIVKVEKYINNQLLQEVLYEYQPLYSDTSYTVNSAVYSKMTPTATLEKQINYTLFDSVGNTLEMNKENDVTTSYVWDYFQRYPIAEVFNSKYKNIFYTSFEDGYSSVTNLYSFSGFKSSTNGIDTTLNDLDNGAYSLSYWKLESGIWNLYKNTVNVTGGNYRINLSGTIDELRFYPSNAKMTTYSYLHNVGVVNIVDLNDRKITYVYDYDKRLTLIKDHDGNIIKKICYNIFNQIEDCSGIESFFSDSLSKYYVRNNCITGSVPDSILVSIDSGKIRSTISKIDANSKAQLYLDSIGQIYANENAACKFYNDYVIDTFFKECSIDYLGSSHSYFIEANTYFSTFSKHVANSIARDSLQVLGQAYANSVGTCTLICTTGNCSGENKRCINNVCETGVIVEIDCEFDPETNKYKHWYVYQFSDMNYSTPWSVIKPFPCAM